MNCPLLHLHLSVSNSGDEFQNRHFRIKSKKRFFIREYRYRWASVKFIEEKPAYLLYFYFVTCIFSLLILPGPVTG